MRQLAPIDWLNQVVPPFFFYLECVKRKQWQLTSDKIFYMFNKTKTFCFYIMFS